MRDILKLKHMKKGLKRVGKVMFRYTIGPIICIGANYIEAEIEISEIYDKTVIKSIEDIKECWGLK